ncbi:L-ribulose-5-phosphate 4-epimerase [Lachnospiraceae bacterium KM106-2]|nr:L-ribulose-5-phosphate 4-epimerase [Lachnospiraceae bacterium KM106-2]
MLHQLKKEVLDIAVRVYNEHLVAGTNGNVSAFDPDTNYVVITPSEYEYSVMSMRDIMVIDLDGNVIEGTHRPSIDWKMHVEIYKNLPHIKSIAHTHSPYATSFAVIQKEIPVILCDMMHYLNGSIEICPACHLGSTDSAKYAIPILEHKNACLMAGHGVIAVGSNVHEAYVNSIYVEDVAKIYHKACCVGEPVLLDC